MRYIMDLESGRKAGIDHVGAHTAIITDMEAAGYKIQPGPYVAYAAAHWYISC